MSDVMIFISAVDNFSDHPVLSASGNHQKYRFKDGTIRLTFFGKWSSGFVKSKT